MIYIVGLGPGSLEYLTQKGEEIIKGSDVLIGGKRNLESIKNFLGKRIELGNNLKEILAYIIEKQDDEQITVLASGDPLIYGIGKYLATHLPLEKLHIVSGISAIQYMFSQIPLDMNNVYITSSHGKKPDFDFLFMHEKVAMVTDSKIGPSEIAQEIIKRGLSKVMWIGENLSYPQERIVKLNPQEVIDKKFEMNVVVIKDEE